jgi:ABC-type multidrug transport system permease subunit
VRKALAIAWKEALALARDPEFLVLQLVYPIFGLVVFGGLFSVTVSGIRVAVEDRDATPETRRFVRELEGSGYFRAAPSDPGARALERSEAAVRLSLGPGVGRDARRGRTPRVSLELDGTDLATARAAESYVLAAAGALARPERAPRSERPSARWETSVATWFNPGLRDADYFLPAILAIVAFGAPVILTSLSLVRERRTGSWVAMRLVPAGDLALFVGKLLPYLVEALVVAACAFAVARLGFDMPLRGPLGPLALATFLYALTGVSLGVVIFALSADEDSAWQYIQLYVLVPALVLSGGIYPLASLAPAVRAASCLSPIRWYLELVRASCLKGADLAVIARPLAALFAFACLTVVFAVTLLRRARLGEA